jgi:hypothetical protein
MFEKMKYLETRADGLRKRMLREPRGYPAANCNLILPPTRPETHADFVIMKQVEYPSMSGTNTICVATALLETGMLPMREPVTELVLEAPAGLVGVRAECANGKVTSVTFRNVPAFAVHLDARVEVPQLGAVTVDVAYGGMFYVIVDAAPFGLRLTPDEGRDIVRIGEMIKAATREQLPVQHPENPEIAGVTIAQLSGPASRPDAHRRNAVIVSTGKLEWDRPATWTGAIDRRLRHRDVREDGGAVRERAASSERPVSSRRHSRDDLYRASGCRDDGGALSRRGAGDHGARLDHRFRAVRGRCRRPVPEGFTVRISGAESFGAPRLRPPAAVCGRARAWRRARSRAIASHRSNRSPIVMERPQRPLNFRR